MKQITYGVRELQAHIGDALRAVERGERVLITSRHRVVAVLSKGNGKIGKETTVERKLRRLASEGKVRLGKPGRIKPFKGFPIHGVTDLFLAERR